MQRTFFRRVGSKFNCLRENEHFLLEAKDFSLHFKLLIPFSRARLASTQTHPSNEAVQSPIKCIVNPVSKPNSRASSSCPHPRTLIGIDIDRRDLCQHSSAQFRESRCFCGVAFKEHVALQPEVSCISEPEVWGASGNTEIVHAESTLQDSNDQNTSHNEAFQAFEDLFNLTKAPGKDADIKGLQGLEALFAQVESSGDLHKIGIACYKLARLFNSFEEPAKVLAYAQKGFNAFKSLETQSAKHAACRCLYAIASAYYGLCQFERALTQAEHLGLVLQQLEKRFPEEDVTFLSYAVQSFVIKCKMSVGRHQDTLPHFRKYLELKEKLVGPGDPELGAAYTQAAETFQEANYPAEAIGLGFKALRIHTKIFGSESYQVACVRRLLSEAYYELGCFEDCLTEYDKARPILEAQEHNSLEAMAPFLLKSALSLIELKKYDKATSRLQEIIENTSKGCDSHALASVMLVKVYALLNVEKDFLACCEKALDVLENHQNASIFTGQNICVLAASLRDEQYHEQAVLLYKKAFQIFNRCPGNEAALKAADTEGEIGIALLRLGKFAQAAPYVKNYALKNKVINGSDNKRLLAVHNRLGAEYLQVGRISEALEQLETARLLLSKDPTGVNEAILIALNQNLATIYKALGRLAEAKECQKIVVDAVKKSRSEEIRSILAEVEKPLEV